MYTNIEDSFNNNCGKSLSIFILSETQISEIRYAFNDSEYNSP